MKDPYDPNDTTIAVCRSRLLRQYLSDEKGIWKIEGECPSLDYNERNHLHTLKYIEGTYKDVVEYALKLPKFFVWGEGGDITKIEIEKI